MADELNKEQKKKDVGNASTNTPTAAGTPEAATGTKTQNAATKTYDNGTDYQQKINDAVAAGNYRNAAQYEQQRNAKIQGEGLNHEQTAQYADYLPNGSKYVQGVLGSVDPSDTSSIYGAYRELITQPAQKTDLSSYINSLYDASLEAGKAAVEQQYAGMDAQLELQKQQAEQAARANATEAAVRAQQAQKAWNEAQTAYGLSSGAQGQAALARSNQLQGDITAIRTAQQAAEAEIEAQRTTYKQQYEAAMREAAANNDLQRAQALYEEAVRQDEAFTAQQEQITQWAMQYLSGLGSAASASGGSSGGYAGTVSAAPEGTDIKVIRELREMVRSGNAQDAQNDLLWYAMQNPAYGTQAVYSMIFSDGTEEFGGGYAGGSRGGSGSGGTSQGKVKQQFM